MRRHLRRVHEGKKDYKCEKCNAAFTEKRRLKSHLQYVHDKNQNMNHKCNYCEKSFILPSMLKNHIKTTHEGKRNYKCDSCGKAFAYSQHLKNHICKCSSCGKSFTQSEYLQIHINNVHEDQTNHQYNEKNEILNNVDESMIESKMTNISKISARMELEKFRLELVKELLDLDDL